jgi:hypothetical protein
VPESEENFDRSFPRIPRITVGFAGAVAVTDALCAPANHSYPKPVHNLMKTKAFFLVWCYFL